MPPRQRLSDAASRSARFERLHALPAAIQANPGLTVRQLARRFNVTPRSIYRDVAALRASGFAIRRARRGFEITSPLPSLPTTPELAPDELLALNFLCRSLDGRIDQPLIRAAFSGLDKLNAASSAFREPRFRRSLADFEKYVSWHHLDLDESEGASTHHFFILYNALLRQRTCEIDYLPVATDESRSTLLFDPYHLHFWSRAWYAIGRSHPHNAVRILKLRRMASISVTANSFARPRFKPDDYLQSAWGIIPDGKPIDVALLVSPTLARNVAEVRWHPTQRHYLLPDGRLHLTFTVSGLTEIAWWLLGYSDQITILKPAELRARVRDLAHCAANHHAAAPVPITVHRLAPARPTRSSGR